LLGPSWHEGGKEGLHRSIFTGNYGY